MRKVGLRREQRRLDWFRCSPSPTEGGASSVFSISGEDISLIIRSPPGTAGPHAIIIAQEVVLPRMAASVDEGLADPRLSIIKESDFPGLAGPRVGRLQAEGRPLGSDQAALFIPWGAGHQGAQEEEEGCREAEPAHLQGLAGGLLRTAGRQGFSQPS